MTNPIVFKPRNAAQRQLQLLWSMSRIIFAIGPAGTGKTTAAFAMALLDNKPILLSRPTIPCDEDLGFLPGTIDEKLLPWLAPFEDVLEGISFTKFVELKNIKAVSVGMLRGRNVKGCLIVDEAQNLKSSQLECIVTRLCAGGKVVICGDPDQSDLRDSPLLDFADKIDDLPGVSRVIFTADQCVRDPLVTQILERIRS